MAGREQEEENSELSHDNLRAGCTCRLFYSRYAPQDVWSSETCFDIRNRHWASDGLLSPSKRGGKLPVLTLCSCAPLDHTGGGTGSGDVRLTPRA